jgi:hypothetical protein
MGRLNSVCNRIGTNGCEGEKCSKSLSMSSGFMMRPGLLSLGMWMRSESMALRAWKGRRSWKVFTGLRVYRETCKGCEFAIGS